MAWQGYKGARYRFVVVLLCVLAFAPIQAHAANGFFSSLWCSIKSLFVPALACYTDERVPATPADGAFIATTVSSTIEPAPEEAGDYTVEMTESGRPVYTRVVEEYHTHITNPTTVVYREVPESQDSSFVTLSMLRKQVDSIMDALRDSRGSSSGGSDTDDSSFADDLAALGDELRDEITTAFADIASSFTTTLLSVTGDAMIGGNLSVAGAMAAGALNVSSLSSAGALTAPYFTATSTSQDSTFARLTMTSATSTNLHVLGTLSLASALGIANGGTGTTTATGASQTLQYLAQGTGALARSIASKFTDTVSVKDYGAVGDGVTDDTTAIQAAIDAAPAGAKVFFPAGQYEITSSILITKSVTLSGAASTTIQYMPGITLTGYHRGMIIIQPTTQDVTGVRVENLVLDGNRQNNTQVIPGGTPTEYNPGISIVPYFYYNVSNVWIQNVHIKNVQGDGITVQSQNSYHYVIPKNITITDNHIEQWYALRQGVAVTAGERVVISRNVFYNTASPLGSCYYGLCYYAIDIEPDGHVGQNVINVQVSDNVITSAAQGIQVHRGGSSVVTGISVHGNLYQGTGSDKRLMSFTGVSDVIEYGNKSAGSHLFTFTASSTTSNILKVGFGTTSPTGTFEIVHPQAPSLYLTRPNLGSSYGAAGVGTLVFRDSDNNLDVATIQAAGYMPGNSGDLIFRTLNNGSNGERLRITSSGTVGIGTTSPSVMFSVGGVAGNATGHGYFTGGLGVGIVNTAAGTFRTTGVITSGSHITMGSLSQLSAAGSSALAASSDGVWRMTNNAGTDFNRLQFGGTTASFPAIKRNGAGLDFRLANDSAYATTTHQGGLFNGAIGIGTTSPSARLSITQSGESAFGGFWLATSDNTDFRSVFMNTSGVLSFYGGDASGTLNTATLNAAGEWTNASDLAYKENIEDLAYGLDALLALQPRSYGIKNTDDRRIGFIAQEVELIIPEVVGGQEGSKGISYGNLVAVAVKAVQELASKVSGFATLFKSERVETDTLCVGATCITEAELVEFLRQSGQASVTLPLAPEAPVEEVPDATEEPEEPQPEPEPVPEPAPEPTPPAEVPEP